MDVCLFILLYHLGIWMITMPSQADFVQRLLMFKATRLEQNESRFYELNCSSSRQSIGNSAEFIIDGQTVEHVLVHDNKCLNSKIEECTIDRCQCFPSDNVYIHKYKDNNPHIEKVIGCQMRFADNETGDVIKAVLSIRINETAVQIYAYDVKILKQHKEKNTDEDNKNSFAEELTKWLPAMFGLLLLIIACLIVVIWCIFRKLAAAGDRKPRDRNKAKFQALNHSSKEDKFRYKKLLQSSQTENRYFVRTMIVGKESTGKTCLLRRLLKEDISDISSTDGVDIVVRRCKIDIENGRWIIGKEIDDDKINRIKRALTQNAEDTDTQHMQIDETTNIKTDLHSGTCSYEKDTTTDKIVSLDTSEDFNECSSLVMSEDDTIDIQINLDTNEEKTESSSLVMPEDLISNVFSTSTVNTPLNHYALCELWDFAGQKEFYATHQAFLTSNAVYLVVADMSDDISKQGLSQCFADFQHIGEYVEFWFDSIHCHRTAEQPASYGNFDPPIILVFTGRDKYDKAQFEKRQQELNNQMDQVLGCQSKYHHLHKTFYLSNMKDIDEVFENLQYEIYKAAQKTITWGNAFPLKWIFLEHLIEINRNMGKQFITFTDMSKLAKHSDINMIEKDELLLFLQFQHHVGNILFFENILDLIILKPQWLADAFRCLVSDKVDDSSLHHREDWTLFIREGKISESLITELFKSKAGSQFSGQQNNLHKVMEKFDILVKIENSSYYIMPHQMPSSTFDFVIETFGILTKNCKRTSWLCFKFKFLPPSFFNHISAWFIRKYIPSKVENGFALYRGICMFDIDESGSQKILVTMSTDTIALQVVSFSEQAGFGNTCSDIYSEVKQLIEDIKQRYKVKISFKLHFKCSDGYYFRDTFEYETLARNKECYCCQHKRVHRSEQLYSPWTQKGDKTIPDIEYEEDKITIIQRI